MDLVDPLVGTELAGYAIESVLGRGGMGVVYVARQRSPERRVALKLVNASVADDGSFRDRFLREARAAAAIEHPHILPVYDAGDAEGVLFLATRLIDGKDLASILREEGPLAADRAVKVVAQTASALDAAHAGGLIHRDVKPGNILVVRPAADEDEFCYLTDFGVSVWTTTDTATTITATGRMVGTLNYVAPEQIDGSRSGPASDIYSLGCVLFECLTGHPPFGGRTPAGTLYAHLNERPPTVTSLRPDLPPEIDAVVSHALEKSPANRHVSARDLANEARAALSSTSAAPTLVRTPRPQPDRPARGRRWLAAAVAAVVALAAVITLAVVVTNGRNGGPSDTGTAGRPPELIREGIQVTASSTAPSSTDAAGNVVTYLPGNVVDGDVETAWRAPGDGRGVTLTLLFDNPADVVRIGLIPGYAKSDPASGVNRFDQNRIIRSVRYLLPGEPPIEQVFRPEPVPQFVHVGVTTRRVTIQIEDTTEPGGGPTFDFTAISEVYVYGFVQ
jgi:serine/threonine protein kinase